MKKITFILISILSLNSFLVSPSFAAGSNNEETILSKANECIEAASSGNAAKLSQIQNPFKKDKTYLACKGKGIEMLYQVMLDLLFSEVDIEIEKYISSLSSRKGDTDLSKEVGDKFALDAGSPDDYATKYSNICTNKILSYSIKFKNKYPDKNINITTNYINGYFGGGNSKKCVNLYKKKIEAYQSVADSKIQRNIINAITADKKAFMSKVKESWERLLTNFDRYIGKYGIIKDQWPQATKKAQN
ncbi:MAG: hypothetical protein PHS92_03000 [Candidatus Gracilibacteria bacterium]|nr:hypothetical protein [Candidatus Gracilibacteria bacterium]